MMEKRALGTHFNAAYLICSTDSRRKKKTLENCADFLQRWDQKCLINIQEKALTSECIPPKDCLLSQGRVS